MSSGGRRWDLDGPCRWAYETGRFDLKKSALAPRLVEGILGNGAIWRTYGTWIGGKRGVLEWMPQTHEPGWRPDTIHWHIQVRRRLHLRIYFWVLFHELAEYLLKLIFPYDGEDRELYANALAAALWLPRQAMAPYLAGPLDLSVAEVFGVDPACYALRWAELTGASVAVVSPGNVHRRGPDWPSETQVRRMAHADEVPPLSGVRRVLRRELPRTEDRNERRVLLMTSEEDWGERRVG